MVIANNQLHIIKDRLLAENEFSFGVMLDVGEGKRYRFTGICPSPALADNTKVINAIVDFFNGHFGTDFVVISSKELLEMCDERQ